MFFLFIIAALNEAGRIVGKLKDVEGRSSKQSMVQVSARQGMIESSGDVDRG